MAPTIRFIRRSAGTGQGLDRAPSVSLNLLSIRESADYAKVSQQTIRRAIKAGHLKTYRAGRQIRINETDLVQYLSQ
jgi:excisionase family DNA binding protein